MDREAKFKKYDGKLPPEVGLIPLVVTTFGAWKCDARANLREIVSHQGRNSSVNSVSLTKQISKHSQYAYNGRTVAYRLREARCRLSTQVLMEFCDLPRFLDFVT